jgi:DNA invertase Pin-like site-specific DNA recombinase
MRGCAHRARPSSAESTPVRDSMLKDASRRKFDIIMAWAIDRLGRLLIDLVCTEN